MRLINILLNIHRLQHLPTPRRLNNHCHQLYVPNHLPTLHDPHSHRLSPIVPIYSHTDIWFLVLLFRLLELDLVILMRVVGEDVGLVDLTPFEDLPGS
jgi:hypothetical protein